MPPVPSGQPGDDPPIAPQTPPPSVPPAVLPGHSARPPHPPQVPPPPRPPDHHVFVSQPASKPRVVTNTYDHDRARWGLGDMLVSIVVFFLGSLALILLVVVTVQSRSDEVPQGPWLVVVAVGPHVLLLAHLLWVSRTKGLGFASDFQLRFRSSDIGLGFGLFFGAIFSAGIVALIIIQLVGEPPTASAVELARESSDGGLTSWLVIFAILGATFVPVVEELVYRGLFWSALEKRGMRPWTILLVTSSVFALIHMEPVRTAVIFVVGLAIGIGRLMTGRVSASIAAHVLINAVAMVATLAEIA